MEAMCGEEMGVIHALIPHDELDQSILDSGAMPSDTLPIESMRLVAADAVMAVSSAIAMADSAEFDCAIRSLAASASIPARDFAGRYLTHLLETIAAMPGAAALGMSEVEPRFQTIRARMTGGVLDGTFARQ